MASSNLPITLLAGDPHPGAREGTAEGIREALEFLAPDELLEVTPRSLRLRKKVLDPGQRKRVERGKAPR